MSLSIIGSCSITFLPISIYVKPEQVFDANYKVNEKESCLFPESNGTYTYEYLCYFHPIIQLEQSDWLPFSNAHPDRYLEAYNIQLHFDGLSENISSLFSLDASWWSEPKIIIDDSFYKNTWDSFDIYISYQLNYCGEKLQRTYFSDKITINKQTEIRQASIGNVGWLPWEPNVSAGYSWIVSDPYPHNKILMGWNHWDNYYTWSKQINAISVSDIVTELYNFSFDVYDALDVNLLLEENNQYYNTENPPVYPFYNGGMTEEQVQECFGIQSDISSANAKHLLIEGIDNNTPNYHLQLGNPYAWRSWVKMFYKCYSFLPDLHKYFDGYSITVPVNKINPTGVFGEPTESYTLTVDDVNAMVTGTY